MPPLEYAARHYDAAGSPELAAVAATQELVQTEVDVVAPAAH